MAPNLDAIRSRIQKCLNLAENDAAMGGEIDNALRFARRLMIQHNLSEAEVRCDAQPKGAHEIAADVEATEYDRVFFQSSGGKLSTWERAVVHAVMDLIGTVSWYRHGTETKKSKYGTIEYDSRGRPRTAVALAIYGPAEDVRDALILIDEWRETIIALARLKYGGVFQGAGRSYCEGFGYALMDKAKAIRAEETTEIRRLDTGRELDLSLLASGSADEKALVLHERGSALALRDATSLMAARKARASTWLEREHDIKLTNRSCGGGGRHYGSAFKAGKSDGRRSSFHHARTPKLGG